MPTFSFADPISDPQAYDVAKIGGIENPGIIAPGGITGFSRKTEWDIKKGKGTKGGTATLSQIPPTEGSIKFLLWSKFHFEAWDQIYRTVFRQDPTKKKVNALDIYHPALAKLDIHSVVVKDIGPETPEGKGMWSITIEFIEYLPPAKKTASSSPSGSGSKDPSKNGPTPVLDARDAEIARLRAEAFPKERVT